MLMDMIPVEPSLKTRADKILKENRLSLTGSRRSVLQLFLSNRSALDHAQIEKGTSEQFDRVTIYRTLQSFLEKGIIHSIPTKDNSTLYALCREDCGQGHHHDNHVHFLCSQCAITTCLDEVLIPEVRLPQGFKPLDAQMTVTGICKRCRELA